MKGRTESNRKGRSTGGTNDAEADLKSKPQRYNQSRVEDEAEERKAGGRARRKSGGEAKKHVGEVAGEACKPHAGRKPRKNGGRTGADGSPFSSARHGTMPAGHKTEAETC